MEKQRRNSSRKSHRRLLTLVRIFSIILSINLQQNTFAQNNDVNDFGKNSARQFLIAKNEESKNSTKQFLIAKSEDLFGSPSETFFADEDVKFSLTIPDTKNSDVYYNFSDIETIFYKSDEDVKEKIYIPLSAYKKEDFFGSTKIEFYLNFTEAGFYEFAPQVLYINNNKNFFYINNITIKENYDNISPRLILQFTRGTNIDGKKIYSDSISTSISESISAEIFQETYFTLYIQFAESYSDFSYTLPEESLFELISQEEVFQITEPDDKIREIAKFKWTILKDGEIFFPKIQVFASDFNGNKTKVLFPDFTLQAKKNDKFSNQKKSTTLSQKIDLSSAFSNEEENKSEIEDSFLRQQELQTLNEVLIKKKKKTIITISIIFLLSITFFLMILLSKKTSKKIKKSSLLIEFCIVAIFISFSLISTSKKGIFSGGMIYSIPEENSAPLSKIERPSIIKIKESGEEWSKISFENIEGWVKTDLIIKKEVSKKFN